jgi:hypothetical protein
MMIVRNRSTTWPSSLGGGPASNAFEQLIDQLAAPREEHAGAPTAQMKVDFDAEVVTLRSEPADGAAEDVECICQI